MAKVLVLGNDPQINSIEFNRLNPDVLTLGVNRIWQKHIPNYFFFSDLIISNELMQHPNSLDRLKKESVVFSSDWLRKNPKNTMPEWTKIHLRPHPRYFPDSVSNAIAIFNKHYKPNCIFYIAGVSLIWQNPSHFWKKANAHHNTVGEDWYLPRFEKIKGNMRRLKETGIHMISVNPKSELNKFLRYENIENLYSPVTLKL